MTTLTASALKPGLKIQNKNNPDWGVFVIDRRYSEGIWEFRNKQTVLFESECQFWNIIE